MKTVACKYCTQQVRPCNLARHVRSHVPKLQQRDWGVLIGPAKRPIRVAKERDRRYDEHVPRGVGPYRHRLYRLRAGELDLVAAAPEPEHVGVAIAELDKDGEFDGRDDSVGWLDTARDPGHWVVSPFTLGRRAA